MLEEWNEKNPALSEDREDDGTTEWKDLRDIVSIRSSAGDLFVDLSEVQVECVASMQAGGESLQNTANTLIKNSVAGKYARRKVN